MKTPASFLQPILATTRSRKTVLVLAGSIVALFAPAAHAQLIWNSAGATDNWSTAAANPNWLPGNVVWTQNESAIFDATSGTPEAIGVTTANVFNNMTFDVTGFSISNGIGSLLLANDLASTITVTNLADSAAIAETIANNAGGASTLTKAGAGTLTLNSSAASTYSGGTIISAGTLAFTNVGSLGVGAVTNNATLNINVGNTAPTGLSNGMSGAGIVNVTLPTGTNTTTLNGNYSAFTGTWNIGIGAAAAAGKVQMNGADNAAATINILVNGTLFSTGSVTHNAAIVLNGGDTGESIGQLRLDSGATWAGPVTLAGDMTGTNDGIVGSNAGTGTISGTISETGGSRVLSKSGGGAIALTGPNTFTGKTAILNGALSAGSLNNVAGGSASSSLGVPTTVANGTIDIGNVAATGQLIYTGAGETTDRVINLNGTTGGATLTQSGAGNLKFASDFTATGLGNKTLTLQGSTAGTGEIAGAIVNSAGLNTGLTKNGTGTWTLGGSNTYTGTTTVNAGTLRLDYGTNDNSKLADTNGPLVFGGGTVELSGGTHAEVALSTTLTAGTNSTVARSSGGAVLQLNFITPNAGNSLTFTGSGIATADTLNTNGILGFWARTNIGGVSSWAANMTDADDGPIVAYAGYSDVTRLGVSAVPNGAANNVRIVNGGAAGNITLAGGALTEAYTLQMDASDGAATIAPAATTDVLNVGNDAGGAIWQTATSGALTVGTVANDGVLTSGATASAATATLRLINDSATNALTVNSTIANNGSDVVNVTRSGVGTVLLAGNNSFTGILTAGTGGTLILSGENSARPAGALGLNTVNAGGILQLQANAGNTSAGVSTALSSEQTANQPLIVSAGGTLQLRGDSSVIFAGGNNFGGLGSATVTIDVNGSGAGKTLTLAPVGFNVNTTTINVTGGNGYVFGTGTINNVTGAANAALTLNPTTAAMSIAGYTGTTAFTSTLVLSGTAAGNSVTGPITNTTSTTPSVISLTKLGSSIWDSAGANTHTGTTTVRQGTLILSGARTVTSGGITVGDTAGLNATLNITNGNFAMTASLFVANGANSSVVNHSGGSIAASGGNFVLIGNVVGSNSLGTYNLSGGTLSTGASAARGVTLGVNSNTTGTFNLSGTGNLSLPTSTLMVARSDDAVTQSSTGNFNQTGAASTATIGTLSIGGGNANTSGNVGNVDLSAGTFTATNFTVLAASPASTATILIRDTALVTLPAFPIARGAGSTATLTFDGGTLIPAAASTAYLGGLTNAFIKNGGAKLDVPAVADITISQILENFAAHTGSLTKVGAGKLTFSGASIYTGATNVDDGALIVTGTLTGSAVNVNTATATVRFAVSQTLPALNIANGATVILSDLPPPAFADEFGAQGDLLASSPAQAVPEPGSIALLLSGLATAFGRRRRRA